MVEYTTKDKSINLWVNRHREGIHVTVRVIPEIEDFFRHHGGGQQMPPLHGRLWKPVPPSTQQPMLWSFEQNLQQSSANPYDIYTTGTALGGDMPNISFLRLVGASSEEGREFLVDCVTSNTEKRELGNRLSEAAERFYIEYIRPQNLNIFVGVVNASRLMDNVPMEGNRL